MSYYHLNDGHLKSSTSLDISCDHSSGTPITTSASSDDSNSGSMLKDGPDLLVNSKRKSQIPSLFNISQITTNSVTVSWNLSDEIAKLRALIYDRTGSKRSPMSLSLNTTKAVNRDIKAVIVLSLSPVSTLNMLPRSSDTGKKPDKWLHQSTDITGSFCIENLLPDTKYTVNLAIRWGINNTVLTSGAGISTNAIGGLPGSLASRLMRSTDQSPTLEPELDFVDPVGEEETDAVSCSLDHDLNTESYGMNCSMTVENPRTVPEIEDKNDGDTDAALQSTAFTLSISSPNSHRKYNAVRDSREESSKTCDISPSSPEKKDQENITCISAISLLVSTEADSLFLLDSTSLPTTMMLGQNALTVRNKMNKKWSTVRATVALSSGVHRWGVHIDRCISKNIFVGVMTEDARCDNYVGCDRHGWAFLANKAIWHNKSKIRSYGELFVTGDMIIVTLNCDTGSLSYTLNGKNLGIAVEGLSGPLYPAFSLYNEDDQLTLIPLKCSNLPRNIEGNGNSVSSKPSSVDDEKSEEVTPSTTENLFNRFEFLEKLLHFLGGHLGDRVTFGHNAPSADMYAELFMRWIRWMCGGGTRTVLSSSGQLTTVSITDKDIFNFFPPFSDTIFKSGEIVQWDENYVVVIGVGNHKLWFQSLDTGNISALTRETFSQLHARGIIKSVSVDNRKAFLDIESMRSDEYPKTYNKFEVMLTDMKKVWTRDLDSLLVLWLELTARKLGVHVCNLTFEDISSPKLSVEQLLGLSASKVRNLYCSTFSPLCELPLSSLRLRAIMILTLNDTVLPLMTMIPSLESDTNRPFPSELIALLFQSKDIFFRQVRNSSSMCASISASLDYLLLYC